MNTQAADDCIRVLIADDDEHILEAYREAFSDVESTQEMRALDALAAELFEPEAEAGTHRAYRAVMQDVARAFGDAYGVPVDDEAAARFGASVADWPPFPDSPAKRALESAATFSVARGS